MPAAPTGTFSCLPRQPGQNDINGRPPVISEAVYNDLTVLLAFRHAVRINYGFDLRKHDVEENLGRLNRIFPAFVMEIQNFLETHVPDDENTQIPKPPG
jgi:hypothetical protein